MAQFYNFNLNLNAINNSYKTPATAAAPAAKSVVPKSDPVNNSDTFQKQDKKTDKKNILILGSIIAIIAILALGIKSGKFKKLFEKISGNTQGSTDKISSTQAIQPEKTAEIVVPEEKEPVITAQQTEKRTTTPKPAKHNMQTPDKQRRAKHKAASEEPKTFNIKNQPETTSPQGSEISAQAQTSAPQAEGSFTGARQVNPRVSMMDFCTIDSIIKRNDGNPTVEDLKAIENVFRMSTDINLYCPEPRRFHEFTPFFSTMLATCKYANLDPEIKHIVIGHGIGSSIAGNWQFEGTHEKVFDFIERNIPSGEKVLLVTCETAQKVKAGLGTAVHTDLADVQKPGKVVESGTRRIIGTYTVNEPKIQYF